MFLVRGGKPFEFQSCRKLEKNSGGGGKSGRGGGGGGNSAENIYNKVRSGEYSQGQLDRDRLNAIREAIHAEKAGDAVNAEKFNKLHATLKAVDERVRSENNAAFSWRQKFATKENGYKSPTLKDYHDAGHTWMKKVF